MLELKRKKIGGAAEVYAFGMAFRVKIEDVRERRTPGSSRPFYEFRVKPAEGMGAAWLPENRLTLIRDGEGVTA